MSRPLKVMCTQCALEAHKCETVLQERDYGDQVLIVIVARIFIHIGVDGKLKNNCRENLPHPWTFTLCDMSEIERVRQVTRDHKARQEVAGMMRIG